MKRVLRPTAVAGGCGAVVALLLGATDASLVIGAALVCGAWVRLVLLGDGERELQRFERTWAPLPECRNQDDPSLRAALPAQEAPRAFRGPPSC
jgi:hypothetical protein